MLYGPTRMRRVCRYAAGLDEMIEHQPAARDLILPRYPDARTDWRSHTRRLVMHSSVKRVCSIAAILVLGLGFTGRALAGGIPWQVGDIAVCYGGGKCNVVRIHGGTVQLLDSLSDGILGNTGGVALDNTLHVLATDDHGGGQSKVVVYSIASVQPFLGTALTHSVINTPYNASGSSGDSAAAIAVNSAGHLFVGNANPASIVELNANGTSTGNVYTFPTSGDCATTTLNSLDIGANADFIYVTAKDGIIRKVSLPLSATSPCVQFANFGSGVTFYGIKDIPSGALAGNCPPGGCPGGESILVVATGFTDPDADTNETGEPSLPNDPDAVNICTNQTDMTPISCALLLDTAGAGLTAKPWVASKLYDIAGTSILDPHSHVQQVSTPGTSGADEPTFDQNQGITPDNLVIWTNQGKKLWQATNLYNSGDLVVDPAGHVQQASVGTSAATEPNPWTDSSAPSFGGITKDGVKWADQGPFAWQMDHSYGVPGSATDPSGIVVDSHGHIQKVTTPGMSGHAAPAFTSNSPSNGQTLDGLTWTNMGSINPDSPPPIWMPNHQYFVVGFQVSDGTNIEQVATPGTSGSDTAPAGGWNPNLNGTTIDNAVIWTDQGGWQANHPYAVGNTAGDTNAHLWQVTIGGKSDLSTAPAFTANDLPGSGFVYEHNAVTWTDLGAWQANHGYTLGAQVGDTGRYLWQETNTQGTSAPAANAPDFTLHDSLNATVKDGLQWTDQANPSVLARYPAPAGVTGLKALALDPLVANCTGGAPLGTACAGAVPAARLVTNSNPPAAPSFWMGDSSGTGTIYRQNFAGGAPTTFSGTCPSGCVIQSLVVYGGESANQPGLASLVLAGSLSSSSLPAPFTATATILGNTITSTLSNNGSGSPPATPISLYASVVDKNSCFNDPSAGSLSCRPTGLAIPSNALVWKIDTPLNGTAALPTTETLNTSFGPAGLAGVDNGTDVFVDEQFDDTTFVGTDPGTRTISVHSLHEVSSVSQDTAQCTYSTPLPNGCYKTNRGTLNFIFSCRGLSQTQFQSMHPALSLVKKNPPRSPQFIPLSGTNGKAPYRFDSKTNSWTFQWNLNGATAGTYQGTTFDSPGVNDNPPVQSFPVTFKLATSCP